MSKNWHSTYREEFRARMVELVRADRTPAEPAEEFEPSSESIRQRARQAALEAGPGGRDAH